jgi:hypothetical protein
MGYVSW